ncbi:MAG TPA: putative Fe-S cluster assembly protein SufT [Thermoanaerobaculia bacterium]|jgi:probable FeS assembly SUF system protein SufT|nr:putative Fe-S cluster assembly protein SufT [Thermoanaerobaculia bacterium]
MNGTEQTLTQREARVIQIPDGTPLVLPAGTSVRIAQALGDTYTLVTPRGQMVRLDAKDADVIGKEAPAAPAASQDGNGDSLEEQVWAQLRTCFDPEIPVNIVDLGLIYDCTVGDADESGGRPAQVKMTLTAPGCGMGQVLADDVKRKLEGLPGIAAADVEVVFDPPWNPNMMTEAAKLQLGMW